MDSISKEIVTGSGTAKTKTRKYFKEPLCLAGRLGIDLQSPVPNGVSVRIELRLANDPFVIMTNSSATLSYELEDLTLEVPCGEYTTQMYKSIQDEFKKGPMILPYTRREIVVNAIPATQRSYLSDTLFSNSLTLPSKVCVAVVKASAYAGNQKENPLEFLHTIDDITIESMGIYINGSPVEGTLSTNPVLDFYRMNTYSYFTDTGFANSIDLQDYLSGFYFMVFDMTTSAGFGPNSLQVPSIRSGHCRLVV